MGGVTFARASAPGEPTLNTPRMPKDDYERLKTTYRNKLASFFPGSAVACLKEAPEKTDYGDIDFIVGFDERVDFVQLAARMGATGIICHHAGFCSLAVRRQEEPELTRSGTENAAASELDAKPNGSKTSKHVSEPGMPSPAVPDTAPRLTVEPQRDRQPIIYKHINENNPKKLKPSTTVTTEEYAQIDIEIVPTHLFEWREFYSSYGDLGGLIGQIMRGFGFTVSDKGIWLRMKELDDSKGLAYVNVADKDGMLWLSSDPDGVMSFLRLDSARYRKGFATLDQMYGWLGTCKLLAMYSSQHKRDTSNDRQKEAKRTVFSSFFNEWLPSQAASQAGEGSLKDNADCSPSRSALIAERARLAEEAIIYFDKRAAYDSVHAALTRSIHSATAAHLLKPLITLHSGRGDKSLTEIVRAFRRFAGVSVTGTLYICEEPHTDAESELDRLLADDKQSLQDVEAVSEWTKQHWEELRKLERERVKERSSERGKTAP